MKSLQSKGIIALFLFLALCKFAAFGQYSYTGESTHSILPYGITSIYPIDSSYNLALQFDTLNNKHFYIFTNIDSVTSSLNYLMNSNIPYGPAFIHSNNKDAIWFAYYTNNYDSLNFFKIDTTGTIVWSYTFPYRAITPTANIKYTFLTKLEDLLFFYSDGTYYDLRLIALNTNGLVTCNSNLDVNVPNNLIKGTIHTDKWSNFYLPFDTIGSFDTISSYNYNEYYGLKNLRKFDSSGNILWTKPIYLMSDTDDVVHYEISSIVARNDSLLLFGSYTYETMADNGTSVAVAPMMAILDSACNQVSIYVDSDSIFASYSLYNPYMGGFNLIGEGPDGKFLFLKQYRNQFNLLPNYYPYFVGYNPITQQIDFEIDLMQLINYTASLTDVESVVPTLFKVDPSGNYSIWMCYNFNNSNYFYNKLYVYLQVDFSGNVLYQFQTENINAIPFPSSNISKYDHSLVKYYTGIINNEFYLYESKWCFNCSPTVTGKVYMDTLFNCTYNAEPNFPYTLVQVDGTQFVFTDSFGNYQAFLDSGIHHLKPVLYNLPYWYSPCFTLPLAVNAPNTPNVSSGNDFPMYFLPNVHDMGNYCGVNCARPGFNAMLYFSCINLGTTLESGIVELRYTDSVFSYINATIPPDSISSGYLAWNYSNLDVFDFVNHGIEFYIPPTVNIGTPFEFQVHSGDVLVDTTPANNTFLFEGITSGSYDPNDKQVFPKGTGPEGYITHQDSLLEYFIRFQNTGTDTAFTVRIEDMLDADLDISTLHIGVSSHPYSVQLMSRKLIFTFSEILLPDSGTNEALSHGFIQFFIEQNPGLLPGTEIKNNASIFFDFNAPIITNTVLNTINLTTALPEEEKAIVGEILKAYPNPFGNTLQLEWNCTDPIHSLTLWNLQGQKVGDFTSLTKGNLSGKVDLGTQSASLPNGIYFLKAETETSLKMLKVVKQ